MMVPATRLHQGQGMMILVACLRHDDDDDSSNMSRHDDVSIKICGLTLNSALFGATGVGSPVDDAPTRTPAGCDATIRKKTLICLDHTVSARSERFKLLWRALP
eukprot:1652512-Rhodomonas_salina.1